MARERKKEGTERTQSLGQCCQQRLGLLQVFGVKAFGEPEDEACWILEVILEMTWLQEPPALAAEIHAFRLIKAATETVHVVSRFRHPVFLALSGL